jgi:hypothetical protein
MSNEDGEKWIVNLIRDSRMGVDAKIDLASVSHASSERCRGPAYPSEHATYLQTACYTNSHAHRDNARFSIPIASHQLRNAECRWRTPRAR